MRGASRPVNLGTPHVKHIRDGDGFVAYMEGKESRASMAVAAGRAGDAGMLLREVHATKKPASMGVLLDAPPIIESPHRCGAYLASGTVKTNETD